MNTVMFDPPQFVSGIETVPYQVSRCCVADHHELGRLTWSTAAAAGQHIIHSG